MCARAQLAADTTGPVVLLQIVADCCCIDLPCHIAPLSLTIVWKVGQRNDSAELNLHIMGHAYDTDISGIDTMEGTGHIPQRSPLEVAPPTQ